jgi:hypothetical protein
MRNMMIEALNFIFGAAFAVRTFEIIPDPGLFISYY